MTTGCIVTTTAGHVLTITINRPDSRNALDSDANYELSAVFDRFDADPDLWLAIVTGSGDRAFCAGADLKQAAAGYKSDRPVVPATGFGGLTARFDRSKPVIAAVNGVATGGGFELALACDIILASDNASFGLTEPRLGLAAIAGGIQRLTREIGSKRANMMLLTGRIVSAPEGEALGFVSKVVPQAELMDQVRALAEEMLKCSPTSLRVTRAIAAAMDGKSIAEAMEAMTGLPAYKAMLASPDLQEGPRAFTERRIPLWANP